MYNPPKDAVVPRSTRNVMGVCVIVFAVNYFVRFFGLSFSVLFGNEIATALSELPDQTFYEILAWMEFDFMSGSVSIIGAFIMLFVVLREAVKLHNVPDVARLEKQHCCVTRSHSQNRVMSYLT